MKSVIIFDMDGTLVDSSLTIVRAINFVRKNLSLPPMKEEVILKKVNDPHLNPALYFYEAPAFTTEHETWFAQYYTQHHEEELRLYDGIEKLLYKLKKKNYQLAVATNAYRVSTIQSLKHLKVLELFDSIVCHDDVTEGKPNPEMLEVILEELKLKSKDALFVGDSERDELASKALNMDYLMVNWGFSNHEDAIGSVKKLEETILEF